MIRFFLCLIVFLSLGVKAQIGINTQEPNPHAVVDMQNLVDDNNNIIPQGLLIPRLTTEQIKVIDVTDPEKVNSLMVYNLDEDCYNYFSKTEESWISVCGGTPGGSKSKYTIDCIKTVLSGEYSVNEELNNSNYITIYVNVNKVGSYAFSVVSENGYYFTASGEFLTTGTFPVKLLGSGAPIAKKDETLSVIGTNGDTGCTVTIKVIDMDAVYSISCDQTIAKGNYEINQVLTADNYINMYVNVSAIGGWQVTSNEVEGISFAGSGEFTTTGEQWIKIPGTGKPTTNNPKTMTLAVATSSSSSGQTGSTYCTVKVRMTLSSKRISAFGMSTHIIAKANDNLDSKYIFRLFGSQANFGLQENSIIRMYPPTYSSATMGFSSIHYPGMSATQIPNYLKLNDGRNSHAFFASYFAGIADQDGADLITEYLNKGGVFVLLSSQIPTSMLNEGNYVSASATVLTRGDGNLALMRNLFGEQVGVDLFTYGSNDIWRLPNGSTSDPILNGPFGDIRNGYLAVSNNFLWQGASTRGVIPVSYSGIPTDKLDWYITSTNYNSDLPLASSNIVAFKAKDYNFIWISDPGLFFYSSSTQDASLTAMLDPINFTPLDIKNDATQVYSRKRTTVNAKFLANLLTWAMDQAEYSGIADK